MYRVQIYNRASEQPVLTLEFHDRRMAVAAWRRAMDTCDETAYAARLIEPAS